MILPNKLFAYEESTLSKFPILLKELKIHPLSVTELYEKTKRRFLDVDDYVDTLCGLFALNKISLDEERSVLMYAKND